MAILFMGTSTKSYALNGHEWAKRQMEKTRVSFNALDNGLLSCERPEGLQNLPTAASTEIRLTELDSFVQKSPSIRRL